MKERNKLVKKKNIWGCRDSILKEKTVKANKARIKGNTDGILADQLF